MQTVSCQILQLFWPASMINLGLYTLVMLAGSGNATLLNFFWKYCKSVAVRREFNYCSYSTEMFAISFAISLLMLRLLLCYCMMWLWYVSCQ